MKQKEKHRIHQFFSSLLVGYLLEMAVEDWRLVSFPAIAADNEAYTITTPFGKAVTYTRRRGDLLHPEREDEATLKRQRASMGEYAFSSQYLQSPVPLDGGLIKEQWFKRYTPDQLPELYFYLQSWDTATTVGELSNYSVCTTWRVVPPYMKFADFYYNEDRYARELSDMYLVDVYRKKLDFPSLRKAVIKLKETYQPQTVLIEDKSSGTPLIQELWSLGYVGVQRYLPPPGCDKFMRMHACCSMLERGHVFLPEQAPWLATYLNEMRAFPHGRFDDEVDSTSQALQWINRDKFRYYSQSNSRVHL